jgi:tetratricopeptide (TPR) repeat protein
MAAQLNLGNAYAKSRQFDEASKVYKAVVAAKPNDFAAHYNLGLMYGRLNLVQEATAELRKAIDIKPDYAEARYTLGLIYFAGGDQAKAIEQYERLKDFKSPLADDLRKKISTTTYGEPKR